MKNQCTARRKRDGERCTQTPVKGATVCFRHGGAAKQVREKGAQRVAEQRAADAVRKLNITPVTNPIDALAALAGEITALKDHLRAEFERLTALRYEGGAGSEQIRGELQAYQAALRDTMNVLSVITRLGIDERQVRLAEQQADLIVQAIDAIVGALGLTAEQHARVPAVAERVLRELVAEATA